MKRKLTPYFHIILLFIVLLVSVSASGQYGTIRGFVYEEETGEPIIFTNVYLYKTSYGAATDVNGYFVISKIEPGNYELMITYLGYDTLRMDVNVEADDIISKQLFLKEASYMLDVVSVSAEKVEAKTQTRTSVVKVTPKMIKQLPTIGGQPDLAQYLQVLPGVVFTGDQGGQLYIRGGSPVQNKVLLDGMIIYNPFHSIGMYSVFDTEIIRNADVYTGGFNAEFGGRLSSVMDITTRDGNKNKLAGKIGFSPFGANLLVEGPIKKLTDDNTSSTSFILSAKNSYLEQSSKYLYSYIDEDGLPFNFRDIYGKVSINGKTGSKVNFFGFNFNDQVNNYQSLADYSWDSYGGGANVVIIPSGSSVLIQGYVAYSNYEITLEEENRKPRTSSVNGFNAGIDFTYFIAKDEIKYGLELSGISTDYSFYNSLGVADNEDPRNTSEVAIFVKYKKTLGDLLLEPGLRMHTYATSSDISWEPRLAMKYNLAEILRLKAAAGIYSQNLISVRSDRDVVNLFNGYIAAPVNLPDYFGGNEISNGPQKAQHAIIGLEYDFTENITMNLEGYLKNFSKLNNLNRQKLFDEQDFPDEPEILTKDFIIENGYATGVDYSLKYDHKGLYVWFVYSFGRVIRNYETFEGEIESYHPHYDRTHNINFLINYAFGKNNSWEVNMRWNFGSGLPFTLTQGYYPLIDFNGGIYDDYLVENEQIGFYYDELNAGRLPDYHRMDVGFKKTLEMKKSMRLEMNAGVTNLYNQKNLFYVDRLTNEKIYQLPIMPSAGINFYF